MTLEASVEAARVVCAPAVTLTAVGLPDVFTACATCKEEFGVAVPRPR